MAKDLIDFSKFKKIFSDEHKTHLQHPKGHTIIIAHIALKPDAKKQLDSLPLHEPAKEVMKHAIENAEHMMEHLAEGGEAKPFHGYNPEKHARTGGLNDKYREKYNREHGSHLKRPVTGNPEPGSEAAGRKKSFCARMKGVHGATSEGGELTPKGAALKRWNCHAHGGSVHDDHDEECEQYAKGGKIKRKEIYGESGEPNPDKKSTKGYYEKQKEALQRLAEKRYGVPLAEAKGKFQYDLRAINKMRKAEGKAPLTLEQVAQSPEYEMVDPWVTHKDKDVIRLKEQKSNPKPDWRSGKLEAQRHIGAKAHEIGHLELMPLGTSLGDMQTHMDEGSALAGREYQGMPKQTELEVQPMAMEEALRRRAGIPQFGRPQYNDPRRGKAKQPLSAESPERVTLDTGRHFGKRLKDPSGTPYDLIGMSRNLSPENRQRLRDIDEGVLKFTPEGGWRYSRDPNALINLRAQGREEEAKRLAGSLYRGDLIDLPHYSEGGEVQHYAFGDEVEGQPSEDPYAQPQIDYTAPERRMPAIPEEAPKMEAAPTPAPKEEGWGESPFLKSLAPPTTPEEMAEWGRPKRVAEPKPLENDINDVQRQIDDARSRGINQGQVLAPLYDKLGKLKETQGKILQGAAGVERAPAGVGPQRAPAVVSVPQQQQPLHPDEQGPVKSAPVSGAMAGMAGTGLPDVYKGMQGGFQQEIGGIQKAAETRGKIGTAVAEALDANVRAAQANQELYNKHFNDLMQEHNNIVDDYYNEQIDPMAAWNDRSVPSKISTAIGLILGGMGGGLLRQENPAMKFLQYQIDKSVEGQKMKLGRENSLLNANMSQFKNVRDAADFTKANLAEIVARQMQQAAAKLEDPLQRALADKEIGNLKRQFIMGPMMRMQFVNSLRDPNATPEMIEQTLKNMEQIMPEDARHYRNQFLPEYGIPERELTDSDRAQLTGLTNFHNRGNELLSLIRQYSGMTGIQIPSPIQQRMKTMAHDLLTDLANANRTDVSEGKMKWLHDQIGNPVGFWDNLVTNQEALKTTMDNLEARQEGILAKGFGSRRARDLIMRQKLKANSRPMPSGGGYSTQGGQTAPRNIQFTPAAAAR